jgi:hypothetical protein
MRLELKIQLTGYARTVGNRANEDVNERLCEDCNSKADHGYSGSDAGKDAW